MSSSQPLAAYRDRPVAILGGGVLGRRIGMIDTRHVLADPMLR